MEASKQIHETILEIFKMKTDPYPKRNIYREGHNQT